MRRTTVFLAGLPLAVATALVASPVAAGAANGPSLAVDVTAGRHAISRDIYGMNFASEDLAAALRLPLVWVWYALLFDHITRATWLAYSFRRGRWRVS